MLLKILGLIFIIFYVVRPLLKFLFKGYIITQVHKYQSENIFREKERAKKEKGTKAKKGKYFKK
jgi:hypothetical protein